MAKEKLNAKQKREREQQLKRAQYRKQNAQIEQRLQEAQRQKEEKKPAAEAAPASTMQKKSLAKANGLKSLLITEDKLLLTSFGKGNEAVVEKVYEKGSLTYEKEPEDFAAADLGQKYEIRRKGIASMPAARADKPEKIRQDMLGAKELLEERYFGKVQKDNLHIQLIYNILDIEKILAVYIENIIFAISNVTGISDDLGDLIGNLGNTKYEKIRQDEKFQKVITSERLRYFGRAFYVCGFDKKARIEKTELRDEKEIFLMLDLLGSLRQFLKHGKGAGKERTWLYNLDRTLTEEKKALLDRIYQEQVDAFNESFLKNSEKDLTVLFQVLGASEESLRREHARVYYRHVALKEARNIGFSVKKLRERMIEEHMSRLKENTYDSVRSKTYKLIDFVIFASYLEEDGQRHAEKMVESLRAALTEAEKEAVYRAEASRLWSGKIADRITGITKKLGDGSLVKDIRIDGALRKEWLDGVQIRAENTGYFSKLMYFLTLFLDGKEINELLTTLINKLENIQSFEDLIAWNHLTDFAKPAQNGYGYEFFARSGEVSAELRTIKSFARMETPLPSAKPFMFLDAARVLGLDGKNMEYTVNEAVFGKNFAEHHEKSKEELKAWYAQNFPGKVFKRNEFFKNDTGLRNFLANNVLESSRFRYLLRYANIRTVKEYAGNPALVLFVLNRIPDSQIRRYWTSCGHDPDCIDYKRMRKVLADDIRRTNFEQFRNVPQKGGTLSTEKQRLQAILGLYLTVLYIITKNLVNVNARYTIAFHCLERDAELFGKEVWYDKTEEHPESARPCCMTDRFIALEEERIRIRRLAGKRANRHSIMYIESNRETLGDEKAFYHWFRLYRNAVAHLTAVSAADQYVGEIKAVDSYFGLYHFLMQRYLSEHPEFAYFQLGEADEKLAERCAWVKETGSCSKELLWRMNVPFAYNVPRYKNLSIANLFDKNELREEKDEPKKD